MMYLSRVMLSSDENVKRESDFFKLSVNGRESLITRQTLIKHKTNNVTIF